MPVRLLAAIGVALVLVVTLVAVSEGGAEAKAPPSGPAVLVELFTSQGCSSCPPADALLRELATDTELANHLVPLSFNVDYWNRLGWKDPFSSSKWSDRQRGYAGKNGFRVYTPQIVVDGREDAVGSSARTVRRALDRAFENRPPVAMRVSVAKQSKEMTVDAVVNWTSKAESSSLVLVLAVYENGLVTDVGRGENGGRVLKNDFVVRKLRKLGDVAGQPGEQRFDATIPFEAGWKRENVGAAIFIQDSETGRVFGAARGS